MSVEPVEVTEIAAEDLSDAINSTLRHSGYTYDQLEAQASADDFDSPRALLAWMSVRRD